MATFSSSSEDPISRVVDVRPDETALHLASQKFEDYYDIDETAQWILNGDYQRVINFVLFMSFSRLRYDEG